MNKKMGYVRVPNIESCNIVISNPPPGCSIPDIRQKHIRVNSFQSIISLHITLSIHENTNDAPTFKLKKTYHQPAINLRLLPSHSVSERNVVTLDRAEPIVYIILSLPPRDLVSTTKSQHYKQAKVLGYRLNGKVNLLCFVSFCFYIICLRCYVLAQIVGVL